MTPRQADLLTFLRRRAMASDVSPSFREMAAHLGLASLGGIYRILAALERDGCITWPGKLDRGLPARSIRVVGIGDYARGYCDGQRHAGEDIGGAA